MSIFAKARTPVQILSTFCLIVPTFCLLVYLLMRSPPYPSHSLGPVDKSTVHNVVWNNAIPAERTAYVYTYTTGRYDDTQRYIATLVSIDALRLTGTTRDIVVIVDPGVSPENIKRLERHGAIVHFLPHRFSFEGFNPEAIASETSSRYDHRAADPLVGKFCQSNFAPIYAWSLYDKYDRVQWLDADLLPQLNMDELFLCGEFCLTFSNLQWYIASLMVLKPSKTEVVRLLNMLHNNEIIKTKLANQDASWFQDPMSCQELFEEFLLMAFFHVESAPLFNPEHPQGQQHDKLMRLHMGYCMNPIFWYEHYDWHLARGKAYSKMTSESEYSIPAHSVAWPRVKPYNWFMGIYWNMNWVWAHWRRILLQESFFATIATCILVASAIYFSVSYSIPMVMAYLAKNMGGANGSQTPNKSSFQFKFQSAMAQVFNFALELSHRIGSSVMGVTLGLMVCVPTGYIAYLMIPFHTTYYVAWPVFIIVFCIFQQTALMIASTLLFYALNSAQAWINTTAILESQHKLLLNFNGKTQTNNGSNSQHDRTLAEKALTIQQNSDKVSSDPLPSILFFLHNGRLSPVSQKLLINSLTSIRQMFWNILLAGGIYGINQLHIYPHFAFKILCIFLEILYFSFALLRPYMTLYLILSFSGGAQHRDD